MSEYDIATLKGDDLAPEERSEQRQADAAYLSALGGYEFQGEKLEPYSALRQAAALNMGLMFGNVPASQFRDVETLDEATGQVVTLKIYPQFFTDVVIVLWLSSQPDTECLSALSAPQSAMLKAMAWAQSIGLTSMDKDGVFSAASAEFGKIMADISSSVTKPKPDAKRQGKPKRGNE